MGSTAVGLHRCGPTAHPLFIPVPGGQFTPPTEGKMTGPRAFILDNVNLHRKESGWIGPGILS